MITGPWLVLAVTVIVAVLVGLLVLYAPSLRTLGRRPAGAPRWRPEASHPGPCSKASDTSSDRVGPSAAPTA